MITKNNYKEYIDDFLTNNLDSDNQKAFKALINQDAAIKAEVDHERTVINTLQSYRKNMLKSRLQNIPVNAGNAAEELWQAAATASIGLVIGLSAFFYLDNSQNNIYSQYNVEGKAGLKHKKVAVKERDNNNLEESNKAPEAETKKITTEKENKSTNKKTDKPQKQLERINDASEKQVDKEKESNKKILANKEKASTKKAIEKEKAEKSISSREKPELDKNFKDSGTPETGQGDLPSSDVSSSSSSSNLKANLEVNNKKSKKYDHHYKYYNDKLFLYGDFGSSHYEILEFNDVNGKELYLYYKDKFYKLKNNQLEITKLKPVKDSKQIKKLKKARKN